MNTIDATQIDATKLRADAVTATMTKNAVVTGSFTGTETMNVIVLGGSRLEFSGSKMTFYGDTDEAARLVVDKVIALYEAR